MGVLDAIVAVAASPITAFLLSVAAIALTLILDRRNRPSRRLEYRASHAWGQLRVEGLDVVSSSLAIWNAGNLPARGDDVAERDVLVLRTDRRAAMMHARVMAATRPANNVTVRIDDADLSAVRIEFDYLDPGDGAVLGIVYAGAESQDLSVAGSIIGGGSPALRRTSIVPVFAGFAICEVLSLVAISAAGPASTMRTLAIVGGLLLYPTWLFIDMKRERDVPMALTSYRTPPDIGQLVLRLRDDEKAAWAKRIRIVARTPGTGA